MRFKYLSLLLAFLILLSGCGKAAPPVEVPAETAATEPTVPAEVQEALQAAEAVAASQTENSFTFFAFADPHFNGQDTAALELAGEAAALIRESADVDFSVLLGGITTDAAQFQQEALQCEVVDGYLKAATDGMPFFAALGEQDSYPVFPVNNPTEAYHFQDLDEHKLRVITLNTSDAESGIGMSAQQLQWFAESLDLSEKADAGDWSILLLSHIPLDFGSLLDTAGQVLGAYLSGTSAEFALGEEQLISCSFEGKNAARIIANIHGHTHNSLTDALYAIDERGAMYRSPIVRIGVPNLSGTNRNPYGTNTTADSNGIEYGESAAVSDSESGAAFNIITVDRENQRISCINYGTGYDREIDYGSGRFAEVPASGTPAPEGTYTNQISLSTEFGRRNVTIFNETGYRNHTYLVCNDIDEEAWPYGHDAEYVTTGAIPFTVPSYLTPPDIYIWGTTLDEDDHTRFFIYDSQKYRLVLQATGSEFKNYFTIEQLGEQYYRLTPIPEGKASVLFPATNGRAGRGSIAFSLKGTGENLVITVGEPILPE